jgi:hypothetical protein
MYEAKAEDSATESAGVESHSPSVSQSFDKPIPTEEAEIDRENTQWKPESRIIIILATLSAVSFIIAVSRAETHADPSKKLNDSDNPQVDAMILVPGLPVSQIPRVLVFSMSAYTSPESRAGIGSYHG